MTQDGKYTYTEPDNSYKQSRANVEKFGLEVINVVASNYLPSFSYSIGLTQTYQHPEIICIGLSMKLAHIIINDVADLIKHGQGIESNKVYTNIFNNSKAMFLNVDPRNIADYFGNGLNYYRGKEFDALQLIWTDHNDKFPWEEGFEEEFLYAQPLLDRNADFKFYESKNMTAFTTRQWLEESKPILRVVHDHDGDWQFLTEDQMSDDIRIVALEELIKRDHSLNDLFDLDYGEEAERKTIAEKWTRSSLH
ncbi:MULTISPECIES: DUF4262 domain-containing protein [unclassified Sphingobacterium]|uniref:DUF4262 domain-containing protein n=1 Tax=unclassified Sphingobacterium TaxID=2609468 RepID=UPI0025E0A7DC|nr:MULTISPECIES: DUF4262 domain-containing protein [unclassified Sphingobacterium]